MNRLSRHRLQAGPTTKQNISGASGSVLRHTRPSKLIAALTALTTMCASSVALQASEPTPEPVHRSAFNWTGFYIGGHAGAGMGRMDGVTDSSEIGAPGDNEDSAFPELFDLDHAIAGIHVGYNRSFGRYVFGVEADWSRYAVSDRVYDAQIDGGNIGNIGLDAQSLGSLRGRLGISSARSLLYMTAGVAWLRGDYDIRDSSTRASGKTDINSVGYVIGGGIEHAITNNVLVRLEGLYYSFNDETGTSALTPDSDPGDFVKVEDIVTARLGVSYRFGYGGQQPQRLHNAQAWRGFYIGAHGGHADINFDNLDDSSELQVTPPDPEDTVTGLLFDLNGGIAGLQAGYNLNHGRMVYGIEFDWTRLSQSQLRYQPDGSSTTGNLNTDNVRVELDSLASLRARVGVTSARTLFYATAGVAWLKGNYTAVNNNDQADSGSAELDATGFVFGGGLEHALRDNLLIRFEGLHYAFDDRISTSDLTSDSDVGDFAEVEDITIYRVGLSYKFNFGGRSELSSLK